MGFEIFGERVFDLSQPFGYFEAFSTIFVVCSLALIGFLILAKNAKAYKNTHSLRAKEKK